MSGGNGTAYGRIEVRPTGGTPFILDGFEMFRFQSPLPDTERSLSTFITQKLVSLTGGEVTFVPQVFSTAPGWWLYPGPVLMLEQ